MELSIIFKIAGVGLITSILCIVLKKSDKDEISTFVTIAGLIIVLIMIVDMVTNLFDTLRSIIGLY